MAEPAGTSGTDAGTLPSDSSDYKALADYLKFARDQIKQDREDFKHKFDWTIRFLAFLLVAVGVPIGFIGLKSLDQLMTEVRDTTKAETDAAKVQREAMRDSLQTMLASIQQTVQSQRDTLQSSLDATKEQLRTATQAELDNVKDAVSKRVDAEFKSDNIAAVVRRVAEERTAKEFTGIVRAEIATGTEDLRGKTKQNEDGLKQVQAQLTLLTSTPHHYVANASEILTSSDGATALVLSAPVESERRQYILQALRKKYVLSHGDSSPGLLEGSEWPPVDWMNQNLKELKETWTVTVGATRAELQIQEQVH